MADVVEEVPAKVEEVESGEDDESDADSIPELEETEAGAGGREGPCSFTPYPTASFNISRAASGSILSTTFKISLR